MEQRQKGEQFRIIEPAVPSESPAAPNRPRLLLYALVLCLGLAAVVMAAEQLDQSFHSGDELRMRTGLLVVSIPPILSAGTSELVASGSASRPSPSWVWSPSWAAPISSPGATESSRRSS